MSSPEEAASVVVVAVEAMDGVAGDTAGPSETADLAAL